MSRIGMKPINIPENVEITIDKNNNVSVKGPKGDLTSTFSNEINITTEDNFIIVTRNNDEKESKSLHGLTRSLLNNMIIGVSEGYSKSLEMVGVGYRAALKGKQLNLQLGFSHDVNYDIPENIKITVEKQTTLKISGSDKQEVGMVASKIKSYRPPEPYKGKGIKEKGQYILRKEGKKK